LVVEELHAEKDPLVIHIFVSRRHYQNKSDTKSGKRPHLSARLSWQQACDLGFRGDLGEWERCQSITAAAPWRSRKHVGDHGFDVAKQGPRH